MKLFLYLLILSFSINAQSNPCEDKRYLTIKEKPLDDMSDREYNYFLSAEKKCEEFSESSAIKTGANKIEKKVVIEKSLNEIQENKSLNKSSIQTKFVVPQCKTCSKPLIHRGKVLTCPNGHEMMKIPDEYKLGGTIEINTSGDKISSGENPQYIYAYGSYDFLGVFTQDVDNGVGESSEEMSDQISFGAELLFKRTKSLRLGGGGEFQMLRKYGKSDFSDLGSLSFFSIYGTTHYYLEPERIYAIGRLGYSQQNFDKDFRGDWEFEPGSYVAIGGGISLNNNFSIEALYSLNFGVGELDFLNNTFKSDFIYKKIGIALKLDLTTKTKQIEKVGLISSSIY